MGVGGTGDEVSKGDVEPSEQAPVGEKETSSVVVDGILGDAQDPRDLDRDQDAPRDQDREERREGAGPRSHPLLGLRAYS